MKKRSKKRITLTTVADTTERKINEQGFLDTAWKRPQDFTRNRKLPFPQLVLFMLNMIRGSILGQPHEKISKKITFPIVR